MGFYGMRKFDNFVIKFLKLKIVQLANIPKKRTHQRRLDDFTPIFIWTESNKFCNIKSTTSILSLSEVFVTDHH